MRAREKRLLSSNRGSISSIVQWELARLAQLGRIALDIDSADLTRLLGGIRIWR